MIASNNNGFQLLYRLLDGTEPGLLEGYGIRTIADIHAVSAALFGQLDWQVTDRLFYRVTLQL
jgi:iron complex outermembrane receptor protein